eukprot:1194905-Prorocentrum_minimum.AAC.8
MEATARDPAPIAPTTCRGRVARFGRSGSTCLYMCVCVCSCVFMCGAYVCSEVACACGLLVVENGRHPVVDRTKARHGTWAYLVLSQNQGCLYQKDSEDKQGTRMSSEIRMSCNISAQAKYVDRQITVGCAVPLPLPSPETVVSFPKAAPVLPETRIPSSGSL